MPTYRLYIPEEIRLFKDRPWPAGTATELPVRELPGPVPLYALARVFWAEGDERLAEFMLELTVTAANGQTWGPMTITMQNHPEYPWADGSLEGSLPDAQGTGDYRFSLVDADDNELDSRTVPVVVDVGLADQLERRAMRRVTR